VAVFLVHAYAATSKVSIPALEQEEQYDLSTAELLAEQSQSEIVVPPQAVPQLPMKRVSRLNGFTNIEDVPTINIPLRNREARN
jgi:hypothetical protein